MSIASRYAYFCGKIVPIADAQISVTTHAFNYGTAAFAGLRGYWNADEAQLFLFRPLDHFERLLASAKFLMMRLPYTPQHLRDIAVALLQREGFRENIYLRPVVYKSAETLDIQLHDLQDDLTMFALPFGTHFKSAAPAHLGISSWRRIDDTMLPARGKISGAYVNSALIQSEAVLSGFDDAVVLTSGSRVAEASAANLFLVRNDQILTPPITDNILEGVMRRSVITLLRDELGLSVKEESLGRSDLHSADEVFLCGTGVQLAPVGKINHHLVGNGETGPVFTALLSLFENVIHGRNAKYRHWNAPVFPILQSASVA